MLTPRAVQLLDPKSISRGMVRVDAGEDLVEALTALARVAGWEDAFVSGAGVLELVELSTGSGTVTLEHAELTALSGRIRREGDELFVILRAAVAVGGKLEYGRIEAAMTGALLLVVDAVNAVPQRHQTAPSPRAEVAAVSPRQFAPAIGETPSPPPAVADSGRNASKPLSQSFSTKPVLHKPPATPFDKEEDEGNPVVAAGDFLEHPQLGLCEVMGDDDSGGTRIRLESGRLRVLKLEHLKVELGRDEAGGHHVFVVVGPRRR